jgi:LmbE family N-acetylglucosaminyl deacetylase
MDFKFSAPGAELYVPDGLEGPQALSRCTHLGVGAHADDLETMAWAQIWECHASSDKWFAGVTTATGGHGAAAETRRREQRKAAGIGAYAAQFQLMHASAALKDPKDGAAVEDFVRILEATQPRHVYTHNLADKHDTHVAVALKLVQALRLLPKEERPQSLTGCEVWRDLDWMDDKDKVLMHSDGRDDLADRLMQSFESQISAGKRYDLAARARRRAHATYFDKGAPDQGTSLSFGMDMTPLIQDDSLEPGALCAAYMKRFEEDVMLRLKRLEGKDGR